MYKEDITVYHKLKYKPREIQLEALEFTKHNIRRGKKNIMLNMPTGTGKSFFSIMFINWYKNYINKDAKFDILTNTKILQNQYMGEFPFLSSLKGKNAYSCNGYKDLSCQEGKEMNKALKKTCTDCPYDRDLLAWKTNDIALTNFHLFDTVNLFLPDLMEEKKPNVLIIDEAHDFESVLCDFISTRLTKASLKRMGFNDISIINIAKDMKNSVKDAASFGEYIEHVFTQKLEALLTQMQTRIGNKTMPNTERIRYSKNITNIKSAKLNFQTFLNDFKNNKENWVMDIEVNRKEKQFPNDYIVQPVWSYSYLKKIIWDKYDHIIFMSGTILDKDLFSYINGLDSKISAYHEIETPFPVKNRPIYYLKVGKMTFNEKVKTFEKQKQYIDKILKRNKDKKGIIHTTNYEISNWLKEYYGEDDRLLFHTPSDRDEILNEHLTSKKPTVLVSPSMMNGVDLKNELSRFQIILKIPYPNIKSQKIKKRQADNKDWYNWKTVLDLIQSYGRSVRHEKDFAETYILDSSFSNIMQYNYKYLPKYFTDAIKVLKLN